VGQAFSLPTRFPAGRAGQKAGGGQKCPPHMILTIICLVAAAYQVFAVAACIVFRRQKSSAGHANPSGVSILKPVKGVDPAFREAIASHTRLHGPHELLCGVTSLDDPAVSVLRDFPAARVLECDTTAPNRKAGVLACLAREARYPLIVVNDADIRVDPDYLERVTAPLGDPRNGLVTCLFRVEGSTFAARFEGLSVSTTFAPSALVARLVGVDEFAMGSTLAFRRADLDRIGGFEAIAAYLADDYQLGARINALGLRCVISDVVVSTHMGGTWSEVWRHQVRWLRTVRVSKPGGYLGLPVTSATVWALVAAALGAWGCAGALLAVRMIAATVAGWFVLRSPDVLKLWLLIPLSDLFGFAVWCTGLFGRTVEWRGRRLRLDSEGRIQ
jgi:ceramide glucosyltransferase